MLRVYLNGTKTPGVCASLDMNPKLKALLIGDFTWGRVTRSLILIPAFVILGLVSIAVFFPDQAIFRPQASSYRDSKDILKITSGGGQTISVKYYENPKAEYTILFSHGNAEDIGLIEPFIKRLRRLGFNVLTYDYQGYGTSSGSPSETNSYKDLDAAFEYLVAEKRISPDKIILHGRSLGGGVAVDLAARKEVAGLILESTFTSAFRVLTRYPILPFDKFESIKKIDKVKCPVLVIHGTDDWTIPFHHGESLFAAANEPKYSVWIEGANHNDLFYTAEERYLKGVSDFVLALSAK